MVMKADEIFSCIKCGGNLDISIISWKCDNCQKSWIVDSDGIVLMAEDNYFFGNNRESLNRLLDEIRKLSFEQLFNNNNIQKLEKEYKDFNYDYCLNPARADWTHLGDFQDKIVLDVACGYGSVSVPLAKIAKTVISIDGTLERVKFLSLIKKLKNIDNIIPIHGNVVKIPIKAGSINAIITVGLLEYAGMFYSKGSPRALQIEFLQYLYQLLSPKGVLWVGIENKLSPIHFIGGTHHDDIPFTPLLPTVFADILTKIIRKQPYKLRLHTEWGYRSLFKQAGFSRVGLYYSFYDYKLPSFIASCRRNGIISHYLKNIKHNGTWKTKVALLLDKFNMAGIFAPAFFIKAVKD